MTSRRHKLLLLVALTFCAAMPGACAQSNEVWSQSHGQFNIASQDTTKLAVDGSHVHLTAGAAVIQAKGNGLVRTPEAIVELTKKSLAFVRTRPNCDHIFVLLGPARVIVGKHVVSLNSGDEAIVSNHDANYKDLVGADEIGRRRFRITKLPDAKSIALNEFSLVQALEREPLLYQLVHSQGKDNKSLKDRLLKMAAVLNIVTSRHGPYTTPH